MAQPERLQEPLPKLRAQLPEPQGVLPGQEAHSELAEPVRPELPGPQAVQPHWAPFQELAAL